MTCLVGCFKSANVTILNQIMSSEEHLSQFSGNFLEKELTIDFDMGINKYIPLTKYMVYRLSQALKSKNEAQTQQLSSMFALIGNKAEFTEAQEMEIRSALLDCFNLPWDMLMRLHEDVGSLLKKRSFEKLDMDHTWTDSAEKLRNPTHHMLRFVDGWR
jgi:hypothetical protein